MECPARLARREVGRDGNIQQAGGSRQLNKVQSSMFKVPSFLINLRRIFKL